MKKTLSILLTILLIVFCSCETIDGTDHESDVTSEYVSPATAFEYEQNDDGITITKYIGESTEVAIPDTIDGKAVTQINRLRYDVTSVRMPDTVLRVADSAFSDCEDLKNVHFPSGLLTIGTRAFYRCTSLESIELPESLESIEYQAFEYCTALKEVAIPKNVIKIGTEAFCYCPLEKITFAENGRLEAIEGAAFLGASVTEIIIPSSVQRLYGSSFADCSSLAKVVLNDGLQIIGNHVLAGSALTELVVPASVTSMSFHSFFSLSEDKKLKVYFEGDIPDDFFRLVDDFNGTLPDDYFQGFSEDFCVTLYHHEGAKGFDFTSERITILTW